MKDLVDMILLIRMEAMNKDVLRQAIQATFKLRGTHPAPTAVPEPPEAWKRLFEVLTKDAI